jgi:hypothetical protein
MDVCQECASDNIDEKSEKEYQGEPPHGGIVEWVIGYRCNDCGHEEEV